MIRAKNDRTAAGDIECAGPDIGAKHDWRETLFGPFIQENKESSKNEAENAVLPTEIALSDAQYDYLGIFFGADYCPHCKLFAPKLIDSHKKLLDKKCKVIFASNDRTEDAFGASCHKLKDIDVIPYDTSRTRKMRDIFDIKTIPALIILKNSDFQKEDPPVITVDGRNSLVDDPEATKFPWPWSRDKTTEDKTEAPVIAGWDRFIISGKYGKWYDLGHKANLLHPNNIYMDEHAVRARAGLLNIITWLAFINVFYWKSKLFARVVWPLVAWEFIMSSIFGLTPIAPLGTLGTLLAMLFHKEPLWMPAKPKRFAWTVGLVIATLCFIFAMLGKERIGKNYEWAIFSTVFLCNLFTWLESSCGFCFGCFVWNHYLAPVLKLEACSECKI